MCLKGISESPPAQSQFIEMYHNIPPLMTLLTLQMLHFIIILQIAILTVKFCGILQWTLKKGIFNKINMKLPSAKTGESAFQVFNFNIEI